MADLAWGIVREQHDIEAQFVSLSKASIDIEAAQQILMRLRVMTAAIARGVGIGDEITERLQWLQIQAANIPPGIVDQLTEAEQDEQSQIPSLFRLTVLAMDPDDISDEERGNYLKWWKRICAHVIGEPNAAAAHELLMWLAGALIRLGFLEENGIPLMAVQYIQILGLGLYNVVYLQLFRNEFNPAHEAGLRALMDDLRVLVQPFLCGEFIMSPDELNPALITEAVLIVYPQVSLDLLASDARECQICLREYGVREGKKAACNPRAASCCSPNTFCDTCLLEWFVEGESETCPTCRKNWQAEFGDVLLSPAS